ncbi:hypothetical protein SCHPADRAFT_530530 [Schizopora paradoxa]|uniref:Uncharacterized protein n=1 Tax=Schizopora paradoxa TaxID=27342 RepID=A0A0H2REE2_9AGAM|nr:hypothetical protein SCHPADRAFT_530530 [Schizopora paradoxa]
MKNTQSNLRDDATKRASAPDVEVVQPDGSNHDEEPEEWDLEVEEWDISEIRRQMDIIASQQVQIRKSIHKRNIMVEICERENVARREELVSISKRIDGLNEELNLARSESLGVSHKESR